MKPAPPAFVIRLQPQPGSGPIRELRWVLKTALRRFGLRCVTVREEASNDHAEADVRAMAALMDRKV
jgi:hypothetical protein